MIVMFVVDTSASMGQVTYRGITLLDCAKSAVEQFIRARQQHPSGMNDRYFLVSCAGGPAALRCGWQDA
eukprot:CAMPEP_0196788020 /NCGR_PEP_ID=MMETSP1104-20130614/24087_1 /TAXON_ID=33652 /ORGANISM="Cafeteria sp., Strain Caron Lab Isolate" /LENGTH=68 /DNA_ID=CAMNT_0042158361 /DNA_START=45 /DNA_END=247 /DNA_ORIENTATION=+